MINLHYKDINEFQLLKVMEVLDQRGTQYADIYKGNDCVWVTTGRISEYFIFRNDQLVDIIVD